MPGQTTFVPYVKEEKRAPTDESVRLLKEMQDEALQSIVDRMHVEDNILNGDAVLFDDYLRGKKIFLIKFKLNGKEYDFKLDADEWKVKTKHDLFIHLYRKASDIIAARFLALATDKKAWELPRGTRDDKE